LLRYLPWKGGAAVSSDELRTHRWGDIHMVVLRGDVDVEVAARLSRTLTKLQREATVFVDLWDVTEMDPVAVAALAAAKLRAETTRWEFAVIAPPGGLVHEEIEAAGLHNALHPFSTRHDAREALRR
jgi:anti-anti-sigma factor